MTTSPVRTRSGARRLSIGMCAALVVLLAVSLVTRIRTTPPTTSRSGPSVPIIDARRIDGHQLALIKLARPTGELTTLTVLAAGRPTFVNLWAQSCIPCVTEMPLIEKVHEANPAISFVGVDVLDRLELAKDMARKTGITYPWIQDQDGSFATDAKTSNLPTSLLLDTHGRVVAAKVGAFHSQRELQRWIDGHLR